MSRRVAVVMGTRPEAIKLAPVIAALVAAPDLEPVVISTGQHREMLDQVIDLFGIDVDHELAVMEPDQTLATLSANLITRLDACLADTEPDLVVVQGDTTTVLMGALAAFYRRIPVGHVEAGLRTGRMDSPFPEEANRRLASPVMNLHFAPTELARANLVGEGISGDDIVVTGNTVIDALFMEIAAQDRPEIAGPLGTELAALGADAWSAGDYVLVTGHRRESFGSGFGEICDALVDLATAFPAVHFVYPVHLNPRVKGPVHERLGGITNISLIAPQEYRVFVALMRGSRLVLTDSGGVQEEAPSLGKPVLVMRDTTERREGVEAGTAKLVGAHRDAIVENVSALLTDDDLHQSMAEAKNPYGDGHASDRIVERIREFFAAD
jgi:UDP-N-acetylglucosamine 2-epimerase (non-hydrolysing)